MVLVECVCGNCGLKFNVERWVVTAGRAKYCSHACYSVAARGKPKLMLRRRSIRVCAVCEKQFEVGGRAGKNQFCSAACAAKARYRSGAVCQPLSDIDASYIAGFFDGEGSYILHGRGDAKTSSITFRVTVVGSKPMVLEWLRDVTGMSGVVISEPSKPGWAPRYVWTVNGDAAVSFTKQILPFVRLKKEQAELGIEFQERLRDPALKADRTWQEEWRQRMRLLNARGTDPRVPSE